MQLKTCLFCKRSLEQFCYSIYDSANQPYLNIMQLFGDVEEALRHGRYICHECLYLIRWIYFMKKILSDALQDEDIGENDRVIPAFQIFKVKMSQPIFVFTEDGGSDGEDETNEENDSENECRTPRNTQDYSFFNGESHVAQKQIENERKIGNDHLDKTDGNLNWWLPQQTCDVNNEKVLCNGENRLMQYSCTANICKHACDTLDELKNHYHHHHSSEQHDLTLDVYGKQLQEFNRHNYSPSSYRRKKFRCLLTHCRKSFKSLDSLSDHKVKEHELLAKFWCGECFNLPFVSQNDLNQHTLIYHSHNDVLRRLSEYPCKYCDKYFLEQNLLTAHQVKHHQVQCQTQSEPRFQNQTSIVKKVVKEYPLTSSAHKSPANQGICSFKVRRQKEVTYIKQTPNEKLNWLKMKYPHAISKSVVSHASQKYVSNVAVGATNEQQKEKVLISLPPRKRRQYQVANEIGEIEHAKVVENLQQIDSVESLHTNSSIMTEIKENMPLDSNKMNIVEKSQAVKVLNSAVDAATSLLENNNLGENAEEMGDKSSHLVNDTLKSVHNEGIVEDAAAIAVMPSEREKTEEISENKPKPKPPLKTYNCRKRKKTHQSTSNASTTSKKPKDSAENVEVSNDMPALHNETEHVHSHSQDTLSTSSSSVPPVISKIEEKDNDNTPGRITMTISLKAIKQYANDKEEKRESKRKKKLKGKRKCKTSPSTSAQETKPQEINSLLNTDTVVVSATEEDTTSKTLNHDNLNVPVENCANANSNSNSNTNFNASNIDEKQVSETPAEIAVEPAEFLHPSRDISESENESRHEIVLNKDEINMIIFGDTMRSNSVCSDVSMINEQIIDGRENQENSITMSLNAAAVENSPKKRGKLKSKVGKKRKIKRKPDKILKLTLDADGKVIDRKKMHKKVSNDVNSDAEETVEGQIANVQLKDHLYARSAFNAFKASKADPSE